MTSSAIGQHISTSRGTSSSLRRSKRTSIRGNVRPPKEEVLHQKGYLYWLVRTPGFELSVGAMIVVNALFMALELQYLGFSLAEDTGHGSADGRSEEVWPHAKEVFNAIFMFFGVAFSLEAAIKIVALRWDYVTDLWNWLDLSVVLVWACSQIAYIGVNMQFLRVLRIVRTMRILRLLKIMNEHMTDSLFLLLSALKASIGTTAVSFLALLTAHSFCALMLCGVLFEFYFSSDPDEAKKQTTVFQYFGSFTRSFLSVMEITLGNWGVICRVLTENVHEAFVVYGVIHKIFLGFAVTAVLTAVFLQETMKAAAMDDNLMARQAKRMRMLHTQKMTMLLDEADITGNGAVEKAEWVKVCEDEWVGNWLRAMDIRPADAGTIFDLIDDDRDGRLNAEELINGTASLKGTSALISMKVLLKEVHRFVQDVRCHALFEQPAVACERR